MDCRNNGCRTNEMPPILSWARFTLGAASNVYEPEDPDDEIPFADLVQQLIQKDPSVQITIIDSVDVI